MRRVIITPGRVLYRPAELHASNRILRNYEGEYALTVSFRDHDFQKLSYSAVDMAPEVVGPILRSGLEVRPHPLAGDEVMKDYSLSISLTLARGKRN